MAVDYVRLCFVCASYDSVDVLIPVLLVFEPWFLLTIAAAVNSVADVH